MTEIIPRKYTVAKEKSLDAISRTIKLISKRDVPETPVALMGRQNVKSRGIMRDIYLVEDKGGVIFEYETNPGRHKVFNVYLYHSPDNHSLRKIVEEDILRQKLVEE